MIEENFDDYLKKSKMNESDIICVSYDSYEKMKTIFNSDGVFKTGANIFIETPYLLVPVDLTKRKLLKEK